MEVILVKKGLWSVVRIAVDGKGKTAWMITAEQQKKIVEQDSVKMEEAHTELILCVDNGQLSHI